MALEACRRDRLEVDTSFIAKKLKKDRGRDIEGYVHWSRGG